MSGADEAETAELRRRADEATAYLRSHDWCPPLRESWFGLHVAGLLAVFLFHAGADGEDGTWLWVVCGEVPTAYFGADVAREPLGVLEAWCALMEEWVAAVRGGGDAGAVFPVALPADAAHAAAVEERVRLLRDEVLPACRGA